MSLLDHADRELRKAGYSPDMEDDLDRGIYISTMKIVEAFSEPGHSGGSAWGHMSMIQRLLAYEPLTPLTDDPDEWMDISEEMGEADCWQNRRDGRMFSGDGGKTYYSVDELRRGWKRKFFGRTGKIYQSERRDKVGA